MDQFPSALAAAALVDGQHFTIPGYGTLEGVYVSAQINHVEREVAPPRLEVTWETTPVPGAQTFAELLVNTGATNAEAIDAQDAWLDALERGERIAIGDLGTLEIDAVTNLARWTPNREALDRAYWSSGAVPVAPLAAPTAAAVNEDLAASAIEPAASAKTAAAAPPAAAAPAARASVIHKREPDGGSGKLLRYAALFAGVLLAVGLLYTAFGGEDVPEDDAKAVTISNDRLNRSPLDGAGADSGVLDDDYEEPDFNADLGPGGSGGFDPADLAGGSAPSSRAPQPSTPSAGTDAEEDRGFDAFTGAGARAGEYVVILGSFRTARNVDRLEQRLLGDGQLPYIDQHNGLTRVGVTVTTSGRKGELTEALAELRRDYAEGAWILE